MNMQPPKILPGYLMSENDELRVRTIAKAMRGIARLVEREEANSHMPEIPTDDVASIFFALADASDMAMDRAHFQTPAAIIGKTETSN